MTFVLENISLSVGQETVIDDVSLTLDQGSMNVLAGPDVGGKDHAHAAHGRIGPADDRTAD